jgi:hypothetical protein
MMRTGRTKLLSRFWKIRSKNLEDSLKEKDELLCSAEGSLVEGQAQNIKLGKELAIAQTLLEENSSRFNHESKALKMTLKVFTPRLRKYYKIKDKYKTNRV